MKEFADGNLKFNEKGRKFFKQVQVVKHSGEKGEIALTNNFSFSHGVFKRRVLQTRKNQDRVE